MDAHRIREIFDAAVDLPKDRRSAFLRERCGPDSAMLDEIARLLWAYESDVEGPDTDDPLESIGPMIGYGAYEVVRELGRGGMGAVFLARRVDGTFERQVAVKVIRGDRVAPSALERFSRERRLLARVDHPGIATLFDAGTTETGMPYFVMEYVDGLPLTHFCDRKRLDLRARVELFMKVCEAVAAAHRAPIVHCDLKPANILVDGNGRPVVLDFGIATALTRGGLEEEAPLDPYGSPRYSSPEQLRGEPLQTTSDIYSLGIILHELLAGQVPEPSSERETGTAGMFPSALFDVGNGVQGARVEQPTEIAARRSTDVVTLAADLRGDLDAIVAKCLQPSPELRYATVDGLHDDLRRWLAGESVTARPQTFAYVSSRFVGRHRGLVAAASAAIVLIAASVGLVIYQWRLAVAARAQAEKRFTDVKQLATSMFDVDTALADVAGATTIRGTIVERATKYLDRLAQDAGADASLAIELAEGYRRVGDMLGNPNTPNLGRRDEALQKYELAGQQIARAEQMRPDDPGVSLARARLDTSRGDVFLSQRQFDLARNAYEGAASIVKALQKRDSASDELSRTLAGIYRPLGQVHLASDRPAEALRVFEQARGLDLAALSRSPGSPEVQRRLALSNMRIAEALAAEGRVTEAVTTFREASDLLDGLSTRDPGSIRLIRDVAVARMRVAGLAADENRGLALSELDQVATTFRQLVRVDPRNAGGQRDLLVALVAVGDTVATSDVARARRSYLEAQRLAEMLNAEPFNDEEAERELQIVKQRLASLSLGPPDPVLSLSLLRNGTVVPFDKHAAPPAVGDEMRLSWRPIAGQSQYVLVFGGEGSARLLSRQDVEAAGWRIRAEGPPPSQTLLLISSTRLLDAAERAALTDRISRVPGPRRVPTDAHILWRTRHEVIDLVGTARGDPDLEWPAQVRAELEKVPDLRFSGRSFAVAGR